MFISVTTYYDPVGQKPIESKCPDCGASNCLELQFFQKRIETGFTKKVTKNVTGILFCKQTNKEVPPVQWSDEIEKLFHAEKQKLTLQPAKLKLTKWFYFIIIVPFVIAMASVIYFFREDMNWRAQTEEIMQIQAGSKVYAMFSYMEKNKITKNGNTWLLVKKISGDTAFLQRHKDFSSDKGFDFDLDASSFTGETFITSLKSLKDRSIEGFDMTNRTFTGYITELKK